MRAVSLTQPWGTLVAMKAKRIDTRSWKTPYRGRIAIHVAKGWPKWARELIETEPFKEVLSRLGSEPKLLLNAMRGRIVATAELVDVVPTEKVRDLTKQERAFGDYGPKRYAWFLENITAVKPAPAAKGALGLWEWSLHEGSA